MITQKKRIKSPIKTTLSLYVNKFKPALFFAERLRTIERRCHRNDTSLLVERHAVDTYLAVDARLVMNEVLVDAVIDDVPLVLARNLEHRVVGSAIDLVLGLLLDNHVAVLVDRDRTEGRLRRAVAYVVVG